MNYSANRSFLSLAIFLVAACGLLFSGCEQGSTLGFTPNECTFSEAHELEGVMVLACDMAFHGKVVTPGLSPALKTEDTTFFVYHYIDKYEPWTICGETVSFLDTVRVLGRTAETKDYNKSTYYLVDIVEVLEVRPAQD